MTVLLSIMRGRTAKVERYRNDEGDYYWCCKTCGNCGPTRQSQKASAKEAADHAARPH